MNRVCFLLQALGALIMVLAAAPMIPAQDETVRDIGSRRELFVDHYLSERLDGVRLELQQPRPGGVAVGGQLSICR